MYKIIVIESDERARERIFGFLDQEDYLLKALNDASEALSFIQSENEDVDLCIVAWDIASQMSGSEFLVRVKQQNNNLPCIVLTSNLDLAMSNRAIAFGALDVLLKPIDGDRLRGSVQKALGDPRVVDPLFNELRKDIIGESQVLLDSVLELAQAIRAGDTSILLIGETGVGKEIFAQLVHKYRKNENAEKIQAINIASLSSSLIESELFGHERGAFTGANHRRIGKFELAGSGVLFLDEIGFLDRQLQPKLLRVIDQRTFYRVGGNEELEFKARLVSATSRNLAEAVRAGLFRDDLYYRVSGFEIRIPPLRDRRDDIPKLAEHFLKKKELYLERETVAILKSYLFPGNVRELQNILIQASAVASGKKILPNDLPNQIMLERQSSDREMRPVWPEFLYSKKRDEALSEIEKRFDREYLPLKISEAGNNRQKAAQNMGITPKTLRQKMRDCGLEHLVGRERGLE